MAKYITFTWSSLPAIFPLNVTFTYRHIILINIEVTTIHLYLSKRELMK